MTGRAFLQAGFRLIGLGCVVLVLSGEGLADQRTERFTLVLNGAGVKDAKTGLIWEQEPDREHDVWSRSNERCAAKTVGGQQGWRGPTIDELKTLIDLSQHDPALPEGHPFAKAAWRRSSLWRRSSSIGGPRTPPSRL